MFAARLFDMHVCPMQTPAVVPIPHVGGPITGPGVPNVLIGGMPASVLGDTCICVGPPDIVASGATNVMVMNRPMSLTLTSMTAHGGKIVAGCFTVMVNNPAAGAANAAAAGAAAAAQGAAAAAGAAAEAAAVMDELGEANDRINELKEMAEDGNLSEAQQLELDELNEQYDDTIDDVGMNDDDFEDWTD